MVDNVIDKTDRVLNRAKYSEEQHKARRGRVEGKVEETKAPHATSTAIATRRFRIVEALDAQTGETIFVVTDGNSRAACSTRELAEKILRSVETAP